jgi:hypothetical protein
MNPGRQKEREEKCDGGEVEQDEGESGEKIQQ